MAAPIAKRFSRPTEQSNFACRSGQIAEMRLCPEHPTANGNRGTQYNRHKRDQHRARCSSDNHHNSGNNNSKGDCDRRDVRHLCEAGRGDRQTRERSKQKARRIRSQPLQNAKEQHAEANRRQDVVVHCVEHILRKESKKQRHPDSQIRPRQRNHARSDVAEPNCHYDDQSIQKPNPIQRLNPG